MEQRRVWASSGQRISWREVVLREQTVDDRWCKDRSLIVPARYDTGLHLTLGQTDAQYQPCQSEMRRYLAPGGYRRYPATHRYVKNNGVTGAGACE